MKSKNDYYYTGITSFDDLHLEKSRLILKSRLIEAKINMKVNAIRETFSLSNLVLSFTRESILPVILSILDAVLMKRNNGKE